MKIELNTNVCPIVIPDTYGTEFCYMINDEDWDSFKKLMLSTAEEYIRDALKDTIFEGAYVRTLHFQSPKYYNFETDMITFEITFDDALISRIKANADSDFFKWAQQNFGSYSGFVSFYPVEREKFYAALNGKSKRDYDFERAVSIYIIYEVSRENNLTELQRDYIMDVEERAHQNGYFEDQEMEVLV